MDRDLPMMANVGRNIWYNFVGADLSSKPGVYKGRVKIPSAGLEEQFQIEVVPKDYGVRRLTLPKNMVDLDRETLERVEKESLLMDRLWRAGPSEPFWREPFIRPLSGDVIGPFGRRSIINNQPRSPHTGVDFRARRGTPAQAINHGRIVFTGTHYFTGRSVVMDHGAGIQSMYFHLDEILVNEGDMVKRGEVIGLVGATGRATGPHLHWGVRILGARIDPMRLIALSQELEESWLKKSSKNP
jgi:murein DD-endopeptidase MepM/ murein hydrolase activator NlpD